MKYIINYQSGGFFYIDKKFNLFKNDEMLTYLNRIFCNLNKILDYLQSIMFYMIEYINNKKKDESNYILKKIINNIDELCNIEKNYIIVDTELCNYISIFDINSTKYCHEIDDYFNQINNLIYSRLDMYLERIIYKFYDIEKKNKYTKYEKKIISKNKEILNNKINIIYNYKDNLNI